MDFILGVSVLYLFLIIMSLFLFFKVEGDVWLQGLFLITFIVSMAFFIPYTYFSNDFLVGDSTNIDRVVLDDLDIFNLGNPTSQEVINGANEFHVVRFDNLDVNTEKRYENVNFCFVYNNTDGGNAVRITNDVEQISDYIYILNETTGQLCTHINESYVRTGINLGVLCEDCSPTNTLNLPKYSGTSVIEAHIDKVDPLSYTLVEEDPHAFWLELASKPYNQLREIWNLSMIVYGLLILAFIMRTIVIFVITTKESVLR